MLTPCSGYSMNWSWEVSLKKIILDIPVVVPGFDWEVNGHVKRKQQSKRRSRQKRTTSSEEIGCISPAQ